MGHRLVVKCPATGKMIGTGIEFATRAQYDPRLIETNTIECPYCGTDHEFTGADTDLEIGGRDD